LKSLLGDQHDEKEGIYAAGIAD